MAEIYVMILDLNISSIAFEILAQTPEFKFLNFSFKRKAKILSINGIMAEK